MDADCRACKHLTFEFEVIGKKRSFVCNYPGKRRHLWAINTASRIRPPAWCPLKRAEEASDG